MAFIGLEKSYDMIHRKVIWHVLEDKHVHKWYIYTTQDMHDGVLTSVRTIAGETDTFLIIIGLNQEFAWSLYLFTLGIDGY